MEHTLIDSLVATCAREERCCVLNSNTSRIPFKQRNGRYDGLAGWGFLDEIRPEMAGLTGLSSFIEKHSGKWMFGFISYDLKNELERLHSEKDDIIGMPLLHFFVPATVVTVKDGRATEIDQGTGEVQPWQGRAETPVMNPAGGKPLTLQKKISRDEYLDTVAALKGHIRHGDIYEVNFCQEYRVRDVSIDPLQTYMRLNRLSPAPMSAFYRLGSRYALSSSPERFIRKSGDRLYSQPIKGTARRGRTDEEDRMLARQLSESEKERAENVMIVDLVRNDLSRVAAPDSVAVEELFGVYPFSAVHQMISTISCSLRTGTTLKEILQATFPMGSMTGAPKIRAMELIEQFESTKRGLFSGSLGYIDPSGDFDFNVMIRSLLYDEGRALSMMTGSAITAGSDARAEYNECLLKASALANALEADIQ